MGSESPSLAETYLCIYSAFLELDKPSNSIVVPPAEKSILLTQGGSETSTWGSGHGRTSQVGREVQVDVVVVDHNVHTAGELDISWTLVLNCMGFHLA